MAGSNERHHTDASQIFHLMMLCELSHGLQLSTIGPLHHVYLLIKIEGLLSSTCMLIESSNIVWVSWPKLFHAKDGLTVWKDMHHAETKFNGHVQIEQHC
jgi:hypothetical protein